MLRSAHRRTSIQDLVALSIFASQGCTRPASAPACGDTATPGCVIEAQAGVPVPPGTGRAEFIRPLGILCGYHVLSASSSCNYQFTNRGAGQNAPTAGLPACPLLAKVEIAKHDLRQL